VRYALSTAGLSRLREILVGRPLLTFDIDGTLAPIVERPWDARLPDAVQEALAALAARATVAIISGRAVADARPMLKFAPRYLIGNHGADGVPGFEGAADGFARTCRAWLDELGAPAEPWRELEGVALEDKTYSLAFHYRTASAPAQMHRLLCERAAGLVPAPVLIDGKRVLNLIPPGAPDKGDALRALLRHSGCDRALYVGDDASDEAVFRLHSTALLTLRIERARGSAADLYLRNQREIVRLTRELARMLPAATRVGGTEPRSVQA
jgi:trehalose 6-phosphate phosphatase